MNFHNAQLRKNRSIRIFASTLLLVIATGIAASILAPTETVLLTVMIGGITAMLAALVHVLNAVDQADHWR